MVGHGPFEPYSKHEADARFAHVDKAGVIDGTGGIQFGNETLAVYDEGTFTPALTFGGGATGLTYTARNGYFVRLGPVVFYELRVILSAKGSSSGVAQIGGLPHTVLINTPGAVVVDNIGVIHGRTRAMATGGQTYITLYDSAATLHSLDNTDLTDTSSFWISGHYRVQ